MFLVNMHIPLTLRKEFFKTTPSMLCPLNVMAFEIQIQSPSLRRGNILTIFYFFEDLKFPLKLSYNPHKDNKPEYNKD